MNKKNFNRLLESVKEAGEILRGEREPSREFYVEVPEGKAKPKIGFVLCIETDDPHLLIPCKVYKATYSSLGYVRIIDEAGESAIYPEDFFIPLTFDAKVEKILEHLQQAA